MKLAIIRRKYNAFGGAELFIERMIKRLCEMDIQTTIISEHWPGVRGELPMVLRAPVSGFSRTRRLLSFKSSVQRILTDSPFDLTQSHERLPGVDVHRLGDGVHLAWVQRLLRNRGLWKSRWINFDPYHRAVIDLEKEMALDQRLHYVANSQLVREELQEFLSVSSERISLIPNGVDTAYFVPATEEKKYSARAMFSIPDGALSICFIGSGFNRKGVRELVYAMRFLPNAVLRICGKDKDSDELRTLIEKEGLAQRVVYVGALSDVRPLLWASDLFALPSLYDPSPNAVLEALACGLPVISTRDIGTATDIVKSGAGALCERDPESIAQALKEVAIKLEQNEASKKARQLSQTFEQGHVTQMWLNFYEKRLLEKG